MNNLIYIAIPFFIISIIVESIYNYKKKLNFYGNKDTFTSLSMGVGNVVIETLIKGVSIFIFFWIYQYRLFDIPNIWWSWVLILFADDFSYYWFHRLSHKSRYLWASHIIHHTSKRYNLSTALRQTWTGLLSGGFIFWIWMPLIGFHPLMIFTMKSINLIYQFWIHTEAIDKMPKFFEFIFNTPSHHRVHHGSDLIYIDKNYAGIFIIWDKLFNTFQPELHRPTYGVMHNIKSYNPFYVAFHEWYSILKDLKISHTFQQNLYYIFKPPGWSHDGSRKTIEELRGA